MRDDGAHGDTEPKGCDDPSGPSVKEGCGVLITCPSSLPVEAPGAQEQNSWLCTTAGREARKCLLFMCKGSCQERRQETAKEYLTTRKGNRTFQKGSHISNQLQQLWQGEELSESLQASVETVGMGKAC